MPQGGNDLSMKSVNQEQVAELVSMDFGILLGSPFSQALAAVEMNSLWTVNFIKAYAFTQSPGQANGLVGSSFGKPKVIKMDYSKTGPDGQVKEGYLSVPLLTLITIPYLRMEEMQIEFNARITSTQEKSISESESTTKSQGAGFNFGFVGASTSTTTTTSQSTREGVNIQREHNFNIKITAKQDVIPVGVERLLDLIESLVGLSNKDKDKGK
mmetsp:Transcript_28825/g.72529  ORF Transcript_28825/g.72529 Transcript_28825/m.72529 type:complete len:213 (+) Transcript_28825:141-779(+)|eukprot:CAMPEP_0177658262 /NCGR_PEP_ID=MMETSP0447-20121125/16701_1 /TAXON_ID=0 /ORGANISM="Stygamoeba regulata, Strain BSH-02190019" /LENGTH=212 /DNA_ID=CAMNT_0019162825 /DNA_START=63 /DNA_END=701 /DNA_ORIENTATION=-